MADVRYNLSNFSGGAISPKFQARTDLSVYYSGCKTLTNFKITKSGGISKRLGLKYIASWENTVANFPHWNLDADEYLVFEEYSGVGNGRVYRFLKDFSMSTINNDHNFDTEEILSSAMKSVSAQQTPTLTHSATWVVSPLAYPMYYDFDMIAIGVSGDDDAINSGRLWDTLVTYGKYEIVGITETSTYISLQDGNIGHAVTDAAWWTLLTRNTHGVIYYVYPFAPLMFYQAVPGSSGVTTPFNAIAKYQNRILFGGQAFAGRPARLVASAPQDPNVFYTGGLGDDEPILFDVYDSVASIKWMEGKTNLFIGTDQGEYIVPVNGGITPTNFSISKISSYGSGDFALQAQDTIIFSGKGNKTLYAINYQDSSQEYIAQEISVNFEHLFTSSIKYMTYQQSAAIIWIVLTDGSCIMFNFDRAVGLMAASKFEIDGNVKQVQVHRYLGEEDRVAFIIERDGTYFLEVGINEEIYLDSYLEVDMTGVTDGVVTGLDHLEGEEVYVVADDIVFGLYTVVSGDVTILDDSNDPYVPTVKAVYAGLPYTATVEPNTLEAKDGAGVNENQLIKYATPYVYKTNDLEIADQSGNFIPVRFRDMDDDMNEQVPEKTVFKRVSIDSSWSREANIQARATLPLPCNILSFVAEVEVS